MVDPNSGGGSRRRGTGGRQVQGHLFLVRANGLNQPKGQEGFRLKPKALPSVTPSICTDRLRGLRNEVPGAVDAGHLPGVEHDALDGAGGVTAGDTEGLGTGSK